jgi:superoxide dismutase
MHCGTCKHWKRPDPEDYWATVGPEDIDTPDEQLKSEIARTYGKCQRIVHVKNTNTANTPAAANDGSGFFACVRCRTDFGCTLYEKSDDVDREPSAQA